MAKENGLIIIVRFLSWYLVREEYIYVIVLIKSTTKSKESLERNEAKWRKPNQAGWELK